MKRLNIVFIIISLFCFTACTIDKTSPTNSNNGINSESSNQNSSSSNSESTNTISNSNAIVIYFSATNHTKNVANTIANYKNLVIHELEPINSYTSADLNYSNQDSRVVQEHQIAQNGERVNTVLKTTSFSEFEEATYIFLGAPVWWQQLSWVIENFVKDNDFSNKTIIPFGTSASSSFNLNNLTPLTADDTNVTWLSGQRFSSNVSSSTVINWIDSLNLDL